MRKYYETSQRLPLLLFLLHGSLENHVALFFYETTYKPGTRGAATQRFLTLICG